MQFKTKDKEIEPNQIASLLTTHFSSLMSEFYEMQTIFLGERYKFHGSLQTANIVICFIKNTHLEIIRQREKKLNFDLSLNNFWENLQNIHIAKQKVVSIVNTTGIPKETVRRKLKTLIKNDFMKIDNNKEYYWNLTSKRKENYFKVVKSDIVAISKFIVGISKCLNLNLSLKEVEKEINEQFSFYFYHYLDCQVRWLKLWQTEIKDIDLMFIAMQALIPTLKYKDKNLNTKNIGIENIHSLIGKINEDNKKKYLDTAISAASISEVTGIPRPTCIRKLEKLVDLGLLVREMKTKRYYVNQNTSDRTKNITSKENITLTISIFSNFLSIVINAIVRKK